MSSWHPVLEGEDARLADAAIDAIAAELADFPLDEDSVTLARGLPGAALFYAYRAFDRDDAQSRNQAAEALERAVGLVMERPAGPYLFPGVTGLAWVVEHAGARLGMLGDDDPNADVDELCLELLAHPASDNAFELMRGVSGLAIYALERLPRPAARQILAGVVDALESMATLDGEHATWRTPPERLPPAKRDHWPAGYLSLGVAHGVPGVLVALAGAVKHGVEAERAARLLERGLHGLWAHRLDGEYAAFPTIAGERTPARAAWCYGDPGIAGTMLAASTAAGLRDWQERAAGLMRLAARRPSPTRAIEEPTFCHGAVGLAHMFQRARVDEEVTIAARNAHRQALAMRRAGWGPGGFWTIDEAPGKAAARVAHAGILDGCAGVGLALLAGTRSLEPDWDRLFGLSIR